MRAIGYYRFTKGQMSLEDLEASFDEYCDLYLHQPIKVFWDSDGADDGNFPQYHRLLEFMDHSQGEYLVVVPKADHLGKDLESVARVIVDLENRGAKVTCNDENLPDPIQNSLHTLGIKGVSRTRSERIKKAMRARALKARALGRPPYGYRNGPDGRLQIVSEESPVAELIYRLYTKEDIGIRLIAQHLNEREIPTRRGGKWNMITIRDILRNPAYMGTYTRFGLRMAKSHEAIIPPKIFRAAQDANRARRPSGRFVNAEPFLLSGLAYCGYCDNKMMGVTRRQSWKRKNGRRSRGVYRYYQCQSRNNLSVCEYHTWRASLLEGTVLSQLNLALRARVLSIDEKEEADDDRRQRIRSIWSARVKNAERRFHHAMQRTAKAEISLGKLAEYLDDLDSNRKGAEKAEHPTDVNETFANWETLEFTERQRFFLENIARIVVKDDTAEVIV